MKHRYIILLLISTLASAQTKTWTLQACMDYAHKHNLQLKQSKLDVAQAKINKLTAKAAYLPSISSNASASWNSGLTKNFTTGVLENQTNFGGNGSISSNINLFSGFSNRYNYKKSLLEMLSAKYQYADMQNNIDLQIATAYMQILLNKENLETARTQLSNSIKQKDRTQEMIDAGVLPKGDLADAEAQITNDNMQVVQAENAYELARLRLAQLLEWDHFDNFEIDTQIDDLQVDEALVQATSESLYRQSLAHSNKVKQAEAQNKISEYQIKLAKANYLPKLSGFLNVNTRYSDRENVGFGGQLTPADPFWNQVRDNKGMSYGLNLSIPILNGFNVRNRVKSARLNKERSMIAAENTRKNLRNNIYQLHQDVQAAFESMKASEANLKAQRKAYNYAKEKFNVGMLDIFDLNTIKTKYTIAEYKYINARYQYLLKVKVLEYTIRG